MLLTGSQRGFTLLEILIVLVLIMTLVAVSLPNFDHFLDSIEIRGQLRKVEHFFRGAREKSITEQMVVEVMVDDNGLLLKQGNSDGVDYNLAIENRNIDQITYYPDGTCTGGMFSIDILDRHLYTVTIDQITGKLEWQAVKGRVE